MPLYEYRCEECGAVFDSIVRSEDKDDVACPECGAPAERQLGGFSIGGGSIARGEKRCYTGG